jgi:uncharacterized protein
LSAFICTIERKRRVFVLTKNDVIQILSNELPYLKANFGVQRIAIFGSFADGTASEKSDVDIFIEFEKRLGLEFIQLADYLEEKLGRKTDILTPGGIRGIRLNKIAEDIRRSLVYV